MSETRPIARVIDLPVAEDYAALRAEGLAHIRKLSGQIWTDHNAHDPGITTLEILAYALTDLAYRTGFPTADLLAGPDGRLDRPEISGLLPAHDILPTAPRTIADYRRLLLRIGGVRNAWLDPMTDPRDTANWRCSEVPLFADCARGTLGHDPVNAAGQANHPVRLSGLYRVLVELEIDDLLGSLNETQLIYQVRRGPLKGVILGFDSSDAALGDGSAAATGAVVAIEAVTVAQDEAGAGTGFNAALTLRFAGDRRVALAACALRVIEDRPRAGAPAVVISAADAQAVLAGGAADDLLTLFWRKQTRRAVALAQLAAVLHAHRGLCEDFLTIDTVAPYRIGVCADVDVTADADLEAVQARCFHALEKYLSAPVRYHTLEEMLAAGQQPDAIFNGPFADPAFTVAGAPVFTKPGFITDDDLAGSELRRQVQGSDMIGLMVDVPGVVAVRNLQLRAYDRNGVAITTSAQWTLTVPAGHQPVFFFPVSKILFHKAGIPYRARAAEFARTLDHLRALDRRDAYVAPDQTLPPPRGRWRHPDAFHSVQHDFPATYKIGAAGISDTEDPARIAQARQFKAYLTFFDQVLADYLGQLMHLRRLYSLDATLTRGWFSPYLRGIAGSLQPFEDEFYVDKAALADDVTRARLNESAESFLERRNRLLDHFIARFAERFADYALLSFRLSGDRLRNAAELIEDKIDFLQAYPKLSRERGQGANLRPENPAQIWDSDNISGLERRVGALLGLDDTRRRDLHCAGHEAALFATAAEAGGARLLIRGADGVALFTSATLFANDAAARAAGARAYPDLRAEGAFEIAATQGTTTFTLSIVAGGTRIAHNQQFDTDLSATLAARAIIDRYDALLLAEGCNNEGLHLIEHILLRPAAPGERLMQICLPDECLFYGDEDPYSFRVSIALPYWPERFRNMHFRALFERTLREEAPAHVQVKICWIGQAQMIELDRAHRAWLTARAARRPDAAEIRATAARLIAVLEAMTSVYPAASLHDCDEGDNETIVRLGATALGIF